MLRGLALDAWKKGGKQWKAWSSRCVSACLLMPGSRRRKLHVVSYYAPTRAASTEDKEAFFQMLDSFISSVPSQESYVILGDFNALVESRESADGQWGAVRGPHGYGVANDAGKELLSFLSCHQATVCNTWFVKRDIHKQTWQHPKSKQWSCIDFVVMKQRNRKLCMVWLHEGSYVQHGSPSCVGKAQALVEWVQEECVGWQNSEGEEV